MLRVTKLKPLIIITQNPRTYNQSLCAQIQQGWQKYFFYVNSWHDFSLNNHMSRHVDLISDRLHFSDNCWYAGAFWKIAMYEKLNG